LLSWSGTAAAAAAEAKIQARSSKVNQPEPTILIQDVSIYTSCPFTQAEKALGLFSRCNMGLLLVLLLLLLYMLLVLQGSSSCCWCCSDAMPA
jgi:hypothetical protein